MVLTDRRRMLINLGLVIGGALLVVAIGYLIGLTHPTPLLAETNSQIAGRVSPRLIDLVAALATGVVGAFVLVRSDLSDTLPGVAIAISLVPPLAVVGLTLESGAPHEALGALLLFGTNVTAIIATGVVVLSLYQLRGAAAAAGRPVGRPSGPTVAVIALAVVLVAVPLGFGSAQVARQQATINLARPVAESWASSQGWQISDLSYRQDVLRIVALGPPPSIDAAALRDQLDAAGLSDVDARVTLVIGGSRYLPDADRPPGVSSTLSERLARSLGRRGDLLAAATMTPSSETPHEELICAVGTGTGVTDRGRRRLQLRPDHGHDLDPAVAETEHLRPRLPDRLGRRSHHRGVGGHLRRAGPSDHLDTVPADGVRDRGGRDRRRLGGLRDRLGCPSRTTARLPPKAPSG